MPNPAAAISAGRRERALGNLEAARSFYCEAAQAYFRENNQLAYAHTIRHIADMYLDESNYGAAPPLYEEALEIYRGDLGTKVLDLANTIRPYALLNEATDNPALARELWREAGNLYASLRLAAGIEECNAHLEHLGAN